MSTESRNAQPTSAYPVLFHSVPEVARILSCGQTTVWMLLRDNKLPVAHLGRRTLVPVAALEAFAASLTSAKS